MISRLCTITYRLRALAQPMRQGTTGGHTMIRTWQMLEHRQNANMVMMLMISGSAASHQTMSALSDLGTSCVEAGGNKPGKYYVADFSFDAAEEDGDHEFFRIARENRKTSFRATGEWWAAMQREVAANMHWEEERASSPSLPSSSSTCRDPVG